MNKHQLIALLLGGGSYQRYHSTNVLVMSMVLFYALRVFIQTKKSILTVQQGLIKNKLPKIWFLVQFYLAIIAKQYWWGSENLLQVDSVKKYVSKFIIFLVGFASKGVLNKDPTIWLDGARSPKRYISK